MHSVTDRQTDRQTDDIIVTIVTIVDRIYSKDKNVNEIMGSFIHYSTAENIENKVYDFFSRHEHRSKLLYTKRRLLYRLID